MPFNECVFAGSRQCTDSEVACDAYHCIDKSKVCDGVAHCRNGKDETNCPVAGLCTSYVFANCILFNKIMYFVVGESDLLNLLLSAFFYVIGHTVPCFVG